MKITDLPLAFNITTETYLKYLQLRFSKKYSLIEIEKMFSNVPLEMYEYIADLFNCDLEEMLNNDIDNIAIYDYSLATADDLVVIAQFNKMVRNYMLMIKLKNDFKNTK